MEWMSELTYWHWLSLGLLLLLFELLSGGGFLLWMGLAALATGIIVIVLPWLSIPIQLIIFAIAAIDASVIWWFYWHKNQHVSDQPALNRRSEQYIGRILTLETEISNGRGKVKVGDTLWRVLGEDMPAGTRVKVVDVDGVLLHVEAVDDE